MDVIYPALVSLKESGLLSILLPTSCGLDGGCGAGELASARQRMATQQGQAELQDRGTRALGGLVEHGCLSALELGTLTQHERGMNAYLVGAGGFLWRRVSGVSLL